MNNTFLGRPSQKIVDFIESQLPTENGYWTDEDGNVFSFYTKSADNSTVKWTKNESSNDPCVIRRFLPSVGYVWAYHEPSVLIKKFRIIAPANSKDLYLPTIKDLKEICMHVIWHKS